MEPKKYFLIIRIDGAWKVCSDLTESYKEVEGWYDEQPTQHNCKIAETIYG
jgi:hypothetical protein